MTAPETLSEFEQLFPETAAALVSLRAALAERDARIAELEGLLRQALDGTDRDGIYKHDLVALVANGAKDGCHTGVGTELRLLIEHVRRQVWAPLPWPGGPALSFLIREHLDELVKERNEYKGAEAEAWQEVAALDQAVKELRAKQEAGPDLRQALSAANAIIGEQADEAKRLQDAVDLLRDALIEYMEAMWEEHTEPNVPGHEARLVLADQRAREALAKTE